MGPVDRKVSSYLGQKMADYVSTLQNQQVAQNSAFTGITYTYEQNPSIFDQNPQLDKTLPAVVAANGQVYQAHIIGSPSPVDAAASIGSGSAAMIHEQPAIGTNEQATSMRILYCNNSDGGPAPAPTVDLSVVFYIWDSVSDKFYYLDSTLPIVQVQADQIFPPPPVGTFYLPALGGLIPYNAGFDGHLSPDGARLLIISFGYGISYSSGSIDSGLVTFVNFNSVRVSWQLFKNIGFKTDLTLSGNARYQITYSTSESGVGTFPVVVPQFGFVLPPAPPNTDVFGPGIEQQDSYSVSYGGITASGYAIGLPIVGWDTLNNPSIGFAGTYGGLQLVPYVLTDNRTLIFSGGGTAHSTITTSGEVTWPTVGIFAFDGILNGPAATYTTPASDIDISRTDPYLLPFSERFDAFKNGSDRITMLLAQTEFPSEVVTYQTVYPADNIVQSSTTPPLAFDDIVGMDTPGLAFKIFDETGPYTVFPDLHSFSFSGVGTTELPNWYKLRANGKLSVLGNLPVPVNVGDPLPSKVVMVNFVWNSLTSKWDKKSTVTSSKTKVPLYTPELIDFAFS